MRQGLGPYFARALLRHGCELAAVSTSRQETAALAHEELRAATGLIVPSYASVDAMLKAHADALDAVIIAAPIASHEAALEAALARGLDVLCEKPFLEVDDGCAERAEALCTRFASSGTRLMIHAQWPETLEAYEALYGKIADAPRSFTMELAPGSLGPRALVDSLPHPLSLLQHVDDSEDAALREISIEVLDEGDTRSGAAERHAVHFVWSSSRARIACEIQLGHMAAPPRPAGYGFDGRYASREIEDPDYRMFFRATAPRWASTEGPADGSKSPSEGRVPVPDPLDARVGRFVQSLELPADASQAFLPARRMRMLRDVLDAYPTP